jgi:hypothetical protein
MTPFFRFLQSNLRATWRAFRYRHLLIDLDYAIQPRPRWGHGENPHPQLLSLLNRQRGAYQVLLKRFLGSVEQLKRIPLLPGGEGCTPYWRNSNLPCLDAVTLYNLLAIHRPARYVEIGSGHSTRFARRAVEDNSLPTQIVSIDPRPRAEVAGICDLVLRHGLEEDDLSIFNKVQSGDFVFFDGTHRVFTNSDVTVFFLEILPRLPAGTFVHFHDIWLPSDYPARWTPCFYSEQYLLAAWLLASPDSLEIVLPNRFVVDDPELSAILDPLWSSLALSGMQNSGGSFWMRIASANPEHPVVGAAPPYQEGSLGSR